MFKMALTGVLMFCFDGTPSQLLSALFFSLVSIKVYSYFDPFIDPLDNLVSEYSQWVTTTVFFCSLGTLM